MRKPKGSNHCCPVVDMISQLPDNVTDKILTRLPIVDAARTAVLSRNWQQKWRNISGLVFGRPFTRKFKNIGHRGLMLAIYEILLLHSGTLNVFALSPSWLESCSAVNPLIHLLSEKKINRLIIHFRKGDFHVLPSYLFSCLQLKVLDLAGCVFNPPSRFGGFRELMKLSLKRVQITNDLFEVFILNCPLLKVLSLKGCIFKEDSCIRITAFNLQTFTYAGSKPLIRFMSVPLLVQLEISVCDCELNGGRYTNLDGVEKLYLDEFFTIIPALRKMVVDYYFLKTLEVRNVSVESSQPPNCLQHLKQLVVFHLLFADTEDISYLLGLIRSSPNLERLTIQTHESDVVPINPFKILGHDQYDFSCDRLQTVALHDFTGIDSEMEFVKFLLSKSPQLKTVSIFTKDGIDDKEKQQIVTEMIRFQRASAAAEIIFRNAEQD